jgi:hypothetical protein
MKNSQNIQISGSGVSFRDIHQNMGSSSEAPVDTPEPVRILFLAANPEGTVALRLDQEVKAIDEALRRSKLANRFELQQSWAVSDRELQDGLLRWEPEIVHLSGHGTPQGRLLLEGDDPAFRELGGSGLPATMGEEDPQVQALARVFDMARGRIRCVVLNACHSETAAQAIAQQVGCVIGMSRSVSDAAAIRFAWAFYNALGYGLSVKKAFEMGTAQMGMIGLGADIPRLHAAGFDPAQLTFG